MKGKIEDDEEPFHPPSATSRPKKKRKVSSTSSKSAKSPAVTTAKPKRSSTKRKSTSVKSETPESLPLPNPIEQKPAVPQYNLFQQYQKVYYIFNNISFLMDFILGLYFQKLRGNGKFFIFLLKYL